MWAYRPMPSFTGKEQLKLFRSSELVGTITNLDSDWPWMRGQIQLSPAAAPYKHIWEFWTTEGNREKEPPFEIPEDISENWFVENEEGERTQIEFPAVHNDGAVWWRNY
jgi:hypothetical protein